MKLMKKCSKAVLAVVLCMLLVTTAWATEQIMASYSATLAPDAICENELNNKTVTLTAKVDEEVMMDSFTAQVKVPEGWTIKEIANSNLEELGEKVDYNLENGMLLWYASEAENVSNDLLATVTIQIPDTLTAGEYTVYFEIIDISRDWGMPWENGQTLEATLTVVDHADGDADHLCDICQGVIAECVYVPDEAVWGEDNTCTVTGTCACGETATATAVVTSQVTPGTCQTAAATTYTATFTEDWITAKTVIKTVEGEKDVNNHVGDQTTTYAPNGDNHTVTVTCACGAVISTENAEHDYTNGDCVCGTAKPEEPVAGLKGDVDVDGDVDMEDFVALAKHVGEVEFITDEVALANAEVTGDGEVNMEDFVKLAQYIGEVITEL